MTDIQTTGQTARGERAARRGADKQLRATMLGRAGVTERRLQLAGFSTAIAESGDGQPLLLLHGPAEHAVKWVPVFPSLASAYRVIAPDLPGHGETDPIRDESGLDRVLDWLGELIDQTCTAPPALVGHAIGGAIAARFAAARGDRIRRLVLVDALGLGPFDPTPEFAEAFGAFAAEVTEEGHDRLWRQCAFDLDSMRKRLGTQWEEIRTYNMDRAHVPELRASQFKLMERYGFPPIPSADLARIAVPVSVIWGRHDRATNLRVAEEASLRYRWTLHVIENAGDDPALEQPEAFVQTLRRVLEHG